jgi:hypothetical protein
LTATIPKLPDQSFTTDYQSRWLSPTPGPSTASQTAQQHNFDQDFPLFGASETLQRAPQASRATATSNILPNSQTRARHFSFNNGVSSNSQYPQSTSLGQNLYSFNQQSYPTTLQQTKPQDLRRRTLSQNIAKHTAFPLRTISAPLPQGEKHSSLKSTRAQLTPSGTMSTAFDSLYLPGGEEFNLFQESAVDLDTSFAMGSDYNTQDNSQDVTISPSELFVDDYGIVSNPPSTTFGNLDTPDSGYLESPAFGSSAYNTSPLHDGSLDETLDLDNMTSLFPHPAMDQFAKPDVKPNFTSINEPTRAAAMERKDSNGMVRQKSSPGRPPTQAFHSRKRSDVCGVTKAAKPRKTLPEIKIDSEDDKETAKRKKNTAAARKSRQRKMDNAEAQQTEIDRLRALVYNLGGDPDAGLSPS